MMLSVYNVNAQGVMCSLGTLLLSPPDGQTKIDRHIFIFINLHSSTISSTLSSLEAVLIITRVVGQGYYESGQRDFTVRWPNQTGRHTHKIQYTFILIFFFLNLFSIFITTTWSGICIWRGGVFHHRMVKQTMPTS